VVGAALRQALKPLRGAPVCPLCIGTSWQAGRSGVQGSRGHDSSGGSQGHVSHRRHCQGLHALQPSPLVLALSCVEATPRGVGAHAEALLWGHPLPTLYCTPSHLLALGAS